MTELPTVAEHLERALKQDGKEKRVKLVALQMLSYLFPKKGPRWAPCGADEIPRGFLVY